MKSPLLLTAATLVVTSAAFAANGTYTNTATGGTWETTTNWAGGIVADGAGAVADFSTLDITADNTVTLGANYTLGTLKFADTTASNKWTLTGSAITIDNNGSAGVIDVVGTTATIGASSGSVSLNTGSGGLNKTGTGTLRIGFSGGSSATFLGSGTFAVQAGTVIQNTSGANNTFDGNYTVASGATLQAGNGDNFGSLFRSTNTTATVTLNGGTLRFSRPGAASITNLNNAVGGTAGTLSVDCGTNGFGQTATGIISGNVGFILTAGKATLSQANTYTGNTTVSAGTLTVSGSVIADNSAGGVTVASGATLVLNGTLKLEGSAATIANAGTVSGTGVLDLQNFFNSYNGGASGSYTLITGTGSKSGATFSVLSSSYNTGVWSSVTFDNTTGNLVFTAVPEPSTYGLIGAGAIAGVAVVRRRKNRRA